MFIKLSDVDLHPTLPKVEIEINRLKIFFLSVPNKPYGFCGPCYLFFLFFLKGQKIIAGRVEIKYGIKLSTYIFASSYKCKYTMCQCVSIHMRVFTAVSV